MAGGRVSSEARGGAELHHTLSDPIVGLRGSELSALFIYLTMLLFKWNCLLTPSEYSRGASPAELISNVAAYASLRTHTCLPVSKWLPFGGWGEDT